ncbi:kinase-like domain-containing protein [Hypoxylon sp. FL0890]|nr:kinase-like domain-containing protein [Hypoxylon sp. FL0890]
MKMSHNSDLEKVSSPHSHLKMSAPRESAVKKGDHGSHDAEGQGAPQTDQPEAPRYRQPDNQHAADYGENGMWLEDFENYKTGGYHPVHIGDVLDGRYEVAHKLGCGGYAMIWLCQDTVALSWKAVKIHLAIHSSEASPEITLKKTLGDSQFVTVPERHFWIEGPNGRHLALVLPVLGPSVLRTRSLVSDIATIHKVCRQIAEALHFFHDKDICHGDFRPSNILHRMHSIDSMSKEQLWELLGAPSSVEHYAPISTIKGDDPSPHAPRYAVRSVDLRRLQDWIIVDEITVIDLGVAFEISKPTEGSGIPAAYAAPELLFDESVGCDTRPTPSLSSDIWSFAWSMIQLYTGQEVYYGNTRDAVGSMEYYLGPMSEEYRETYIRKHPAPSQTEDQGELGDYNSEGDEYDDYDYEDQYNCEWPVVPVDTRRDDYYFVWKAKDLQQERKKLMITGYADLLHAKLGEKLNLGGFGFAKEQSYCLPRHEVVQLSDLLRRMLRYKPEERLSATEVLDHPWFVNHGRKPQLMAANDTSLPQDVKTKLQELMNLLRNNTQSTLM